MSLMGLDIGTTGCKAVVFDVRGQPLSSHSEEYPLRGRTPSDVTLSVRLSSRRSQAQDGSSE